MSRQVVPNKTEMRRYLAQGLTQHQIVEAWEADSGVRVSRPAIAMAIARYDLKSQRSRPRYEDMLPWHVKQEHQNDHNARMLRLEGRRREGLKMTEQETRWLRGFTQSLREANAVVTYTPETGFVWVGRQPDDDDMIRRNPLGQGKGVRRVAG